MGSDVIQGLMMVMDPLVILFIIIGVFISENDLLTSSSLLCMISQSRSNSTHGMEIKVKSET